ncbi:MAG: hypothetical protein JJT93_07230 [Gammaproteobacteria bacterium]|nr:hypothetical protein [Gammaproteobacteria bacterium]TVQ46379.1 MAG: hypothetical protein EA371_10440 [Gammaproteobacteria bacterium]
MDAAPHTAGDARLRQRLWQQLEPGPASIFDLLALARHRFELLLSLVIALSLMLLHLTEVIGRNTAAVDQDNRE